MINNAASWPTDIGLAPFLHPGCFVLHSISYQKIANITQIAFKSHARMHVQ